MGEHTHLTTGDVLFCSHVLMSKVRLKMMKQTMQVSKMYVFHVHTRSYSCTLMTLHRRPWWNLTAPACKGGLDVSKNQSGLNLLGNLK